MRAARRKELLLLLERVNGRTPEREWAHKAPPKGFLHEDECIIGVCL
jgi:hypothetical protein